MEPQHWNLFKFKIWHDKRIVWTMNIVPTVRFDSVGSVGEVVGPDGQPSGALFFNVGGMLVYIFWRRYR